MSDYHTPVMLDESISALVTNPSGTYADATFGGGGHTAELLSRLNEDGHVIAFDRDSDAIDNRIDDPRLTLVRADFRFIHNFVLDLAHKTGDKALGAKLFGGLDGILADLGVSSHQFDTAERGFSFRYDAPLDMRMNREGGKTAADVVNEYSQEDLESLLRIYGEVDNARKVAQLIVSARDKRGISTTGELDEAIRPALPKFAEHKFLAKVYQALRIEVNHEMRSLEKFLEGAADTLRPGGRLVVITYHSLEDRMVKNFIKTGRADGKEEKDVFGNIHAPLKAVNRKPILPQESEIASNTRARSAKLRIAEKQKRKEGTRHDGTEKMEVLRHPAVVQERGSGHDKGGVFAEVARQPLLHPHHLHVLLVLGQHLAESQDREDAHKGRGEQEGAGGRGDLPRSEDR